MQLIRRAAPDIMVIVLLFVLPLVFFFPQTLGGRTLIPTENLFQYEPYASASAAVDAPQRPHNHLVSDAILQNYQWKDFIREQIAIGEVPLWNPHQFAGIPFLAAGQHSALYPLSVVYYAMPLWQAYGWFTVLNIWLAGVFMYFFARGLGIGRAGAMLAGVIYQFNGFVLASVVFQMMIGGLPWVPLMLLMIEYIIRQRRLFGRKTRIPWVAIGAFALMMNVLAGHVEITLYALLMSGFYAGARLLHDFMRVKQLPQLLSQVGWLLTMIIIGMGLAAIQFLPLYDFVQSNWRAERSDYQEVVEFAHPPRDILQFALPNFYGNPTHHRVYDVFNFEWVDDWEKDPEDGQEEQTHTDWGVKNYVEGALYLGLLPLLLAVYAAIDRTMWSMAQDGKLVTVFMREPPYRAIFGTMGLLSLTFMFGLPTYRLIYALPGINQLNSPFRWIYGLTVAVAIMAAFGLDALQRRAAETYTRGETRTGYGLIMLSGLVFVGLAGTYAAFDSLAPIIERALDSLTFARRAFGEGTADLFYSYQFANGLVLAVMLFLSGVVFFWVGRMRMYRHVQKWGFFAVAVVVADLMIASWGFNPASDPLLLDYTPQPIQWLQERQEDGEIFRYTTLEPPNATPILNANSTMQYGLDDIRGYDSIIPLRYVNYMRELAPQVQLGFNRVAPIFVDENFYEGHPQLDYVQVLDSSLLALLNVRYIVTYPEVLIPFADWDVVCCDDTVLIYENPLVMPRAFTILADEMTLPIGAEAGYPNGDVPLPEYTPATITQTSGRETFVDMNVSADAWLVVSENYASGWRAFIRPRGAGQDNEMPLEVMPVASILQGVELEFAAIDAFFAERDLADDAAQALAKGDFTVRMVYSPTSVQIGFFGSAISAIALTLLVGMWLWTIFVGTNTDDSSQSARVARNSIAPIILNLFNRGIDFVFAIVLYRLLSQEMVGIYNFAVVIFVWFDIFTNFGLDLFLMREVSKDKAKSAFYLFNTSFFRFFLSVVGFGLLILFLVFWQNSIDPLPIEGLIALVLLYVGLFPASLNKGMTSLFYAHEQAEKPAAIATITTINKAIFGVIVLLLGWGIVGIAAVSIVNNFITLGVLVWAGRDFIDDIPRKIDRPLLKEMVSESYPLMLNHFLATIFFQIDIVILQALRGAVTVAQYSTSYKWLLALNIIPAFFTQALFPLMSRQAEEDKARLKLTYTFGLKLLVALALPIAVGFTVLASLLTLILAGASYLPNGAIALTIMIWSIPIGWMNSLTQYALIALGLQRYITWAFFGAVTFNIVSNMIFIPVYGFQAAAITTILSEAALLIPFAVLMHRGLQDSINWLGLVWRPVVATGAMIAVVVVLLPINMFVALVVASAVYLGVLLLLKPLDEPELAILRPMVPARIKNLPLIRSVLME